MDSTEQNETTESATSSSGDILVVTSKVKKYVKEAAEMNTAGNVAEVLSNKVRTLLNEAIERAKADGRKTLKDRDFV